MVIQEQPQLQASLARPAGLVLISGTPKGRGVFAAQDIPARTVVDVCPVLVLDVEENANHIEQTALYHYTYNWPYRDRDGRTKHRQAVVFGLGSMFNHSTADQNVGWERDVEHELITYKALRDIRAGEELCISYGSKLWFTDTDAPKDLGDGDGTDVLNSIRLDD
ncbi:hypothetical protein BJ546DRAFT_638463 [Cryomyces antarcticus]